MNFPEDGFDAAVAKFLYENGPVETLEALVSDWDDSYKNEVTPHHKALESAHLGISAAMGKELPDHILENYKLAGTADRLHSFSN